MHGLETIVKLNATGSKPALTTPCEADELKDIGELVGKLRNASPTTVGHGWMEMMVQLDHIDSARIADYLVAAYGIQE